MDLSEARVLRNCVASAHNSDAALKCQLLLLIREMRVTAADASASVCRRENVELFPASVSIVKMAVGETPANKKEAVREFHFNARAPNY